MRLQCPLEGTNYQGYCVDNVALVRFKSRKCNHVKDCEEIKERLDNESRNLHEGRMPVLRTGEESNEE